MDGNNLIYEYEKYYLDALCKNRNLLFSRAEEIALHKIFFAQLKKKTADNAGLELLLKNRVDVLDEVCRFGKDYYKQELERLCGEIIDAWIQAVMQKGDEHSQK